MNKFLLTIAALPALALASDAAAQTRGQVRGEVAIENRIANLEARIDAGVQAGAIDRNEARQLRRQVRDLRQLELSYSGDGLSRQERMTLQQRVRTLGADVRLAGGTNWSNRYGWADSDFDDDRYEYGARSYESDRYGNRVGEVYYDGRGGPYEPAETTTRSGGILGGLLGSRSATGGSGSFRIGDLISGVLGGSLNSGSSLGYRDRSDVYFRSDGRQVYEIDARTNRVVRIHPVR